MKFKILRSKFIEGLKSVQNIVASKSTVPVMQNVLIEAKGRELTLTTTDLDISIKAKVECEVGESGISTLPVRFLFNSVSKSADGDVEVEIDAGDNATLKAGSAKFRIAGISEKDFPRLPVGDEANQYTLSQQILREMLRKTSYAASQDDTRRTLKGELLSFKNGKLTMVATDGRRLALVENEVEFPQSAEKDIVLPFKAVQELQRSLTGTEDVVVKVYKSQICFNFGNVEIYSKLMDDAYPDYTQVIPRECAQQVAIDRQLLLNALERASVMTMDEAHSTKLVFEGGRLTVASAASEIGEAKDEVPIKYAGEKLEIMFNPTYLMEPLRAIDDDEITINLNNGHTPAVIKCGIPFLYVLMPLRTS